MSSAVVSSSSFVSSCCLFIIFSLSQKLSSYHWMLLFLNAYHCFLYRKQLIATYYFELCTHTHTHTHTHVHTYTYTQTHRHTCTCTHAPMHAQTPCLAFTLPIRVTWSSCKKQEEVKTKSHIGGLHVLR